MNHRLKDYDKYIPDNPIVIGDDCWLATGATILSGVQLGNHVVVGAGSVITRSFSENDLLVVGAPTRVSES
ncbi:MAG: hypothetical protein JXB07_12165 [Anaerolineae bacterium]|nr:hypothetical protein [Anaerolineae bacterium]